MSAAALIARATAAGVRLWVEGEQVRVRAARPPAPDLLADLRAHRDEVRLLLVAEKVRHRAAPSSGDASSPPRDAWGLTDADKAKGIARIFGTARPAPSPAASDPAPMDHDAGERAAMAAYYAAEPASTYRPDQPDELRDGLARGFHAHRHVWDALPFGEERGAAFADAKAHPDACSSCAGRRWWRGFDEPDTARRCSTCHPPAHLKPEDVETITT